MRFPGRLDLIAVGKLKTAHWAAAQADYAARLERYISFQITEVKDAVGGGRPDPVAVAKEGEALLAAAAASHRLIALTPEGQQTHSPGLARFLRGQIERYGRIAFFIGGSVGLSTAVLDASHFHLALSPLTFPHELARVILLEQLYRAFTILSNEPYHK